MAHRNSFAEMKAEQARMTASWKEEGRLSEAWVVADPGIVEIFSAGVTFGLEVGRRGRTDPLLSGRVAPGAACSRGKRRIEEKLERTKVEMPKKEKE